MSPADDSCHGSDYGRDVLTNLDSDIFKSSACQAPTEKTDKTVPVTSRTQNIAARREKIVPAPRATKVKESSDITKGTKFTRSSFDKLTSWL